MGVLTPNRWFQTSKYVPQALTYDSSCTKPNISCFLRPKQKFRSFQMTSFYFNPQNKPAYSSFWSNSSDFFFLSQNFFYESTHCNVYMYLYWILRLESTVHWKNINLFFISLAILYSKRLLSPINMRGPSTYWKSQTKKQRKEKLCTDII